MNRSIFKSKRGEFKRKNEALKDMVLGRMAADIEVNIKTSDGTPVKTGLMKSQVRHFKNINGQWRVEADAVYSAFQERGARADGTHKVKVYTTSGTSAGWFMRAIEAAKRNKTSYVSEARRALNL